MANGVQKKQGAEIAVIGGSGFYSLLENASEVRCETPYGEPSDAIALGSVSGRRVAFLPRHGRRHSLPPHAINYRANIWALKELGVQRIIAPCAAGSLQARVKPGDFVICDQFVDRTCGRKDTFYDGPKTTHVSAAEPYCETLRRVAAESAEELGIAAHPRGTVVVVQGPRFSTKAESRWYSSLGDVINMTQYPECVLARELEMCYANISLITDYDAGLVGAQPVTQHEVKRMFNANLHALRKLLYEIIPKIPRKRDCECAEALKHAVF